MNNRIIICTGIILFFAALGILAYNFLEIYPTKKYVHPSREVNSNSYYALEQWLLETGHEVDTNTYFHQHITETPNEKIVIANYGEIPWYRWEEINSWIEQGGNLVVFIDNYRNVISENFINFLSDHGITIEYNATIYSRPEINIDDDPSMPPAEDIYPFFDNFISFLTDPIELPEEEITLTKDENGIVRLVEIYAGKGTLTVTGVPIFMYNHNIRTEANAVLSWRLTGERASGGDENNNGILFIRSQNYRQARNSIFGPTMERGNLIPFIVSALLIIILGFWMVIPAFGLVFFEKQRTAKPIKDRFTAEIRFLKKYDALDHYLGASDDTDNEKIYDYRELINQYRSKFDGTAKS
jgi:hypothetical protein